MWTSYFILSKIEIVVITPKQADEILAELCEGKTLSQCLKEREISPWTFSKYRQSNPLFAEAYAGARQIGAELQVDEIIPISDDAFIDPQRAKNMIDARKWRVSKLIPHIYGDRLDLNVTGTVDLNAALIEARKRALPVCDQDNVAHAQIIDTPQIVDDSAPDSQSENDLSSKLSEDIFD